MLRINWSALVYVAVRAIGAAYTAKTPVRERRLAFDYNMSLRSTKLTLILECAV